MTLFERAKQYDLPEFARSSGYELRKQGAGFCCKTCPACGDGSSNALSFFFSKEGIWRWNCFRCKKGGTTVDFAVAIWNVSEIDAARKLTQGGIGNVVIKQSTPIVKTPVSIKAMDDAISSIGKLGHTSVKEGLDYLRSRGIGDQVITEAVRRGILRFLPAKPHLANRFLIDAIGTGNMIKAGLLKPDSKWPAIAFRPLVAFFPGGGAAEFRLIREVKEDEPKAIRYGTPKWPWWWRDGDTVTSVRVVEGVIDLLSRAEIGLEHGESIMSLPGTSSWSLHWFQDMLSRHPSVKIIISFDNDDGGRAAAIHLKKVLFENDITNVIIEHPVESDWNVQLLAMSTLKLCDARQAA